LRLDESLLSGNSWWHPLRLDSSHLHWRPLRKSELPDGVFFNPAQYFLTGSAKHFFESWADGGRFILFNDQ
jgi:hypothetical protein